MITDREKVKKYHLRRSPAFRFMLKNPNIVTGVLSIIFVSLLLSYMYTGRCPCNDLYFGGPRDKLVKLFSNLSYEDLRETGCAKIPGEVHKTTNEHLYNACIKADGVIALLSIFFYMWFQWKSFSQKGKEML